MKLLLKTFLFFLLSLILSFLLSFTFLMVEIMVIGVINALFEIGLSHNSNLLSFLFWINFVVFTLILFFKFTSLKGKKSELSFFENYQSRKEKDYVKMGLVRDFLICILRGKKKNHTQELLAQGYGFFVVLFI